MASTLVMTVPAHAQLRYSEVAGADGVPLLVAEAGNPDGPPILFIHGFAQSHLAFQSQFESDLAEDFRLIAFDLRGHGGSAKPWRKEDYEASRGVWADDVAAVIAAKDLHNVTLVGWSFGGFIAVDYLRKFGAERVSALNLDGTVAGLAEPVAQAEMDKSLVEGARRRSSVDLSENIVGALEVADGFTHHPMPGVRRRVADAAALMVPSLSRRLMTDLPVNHVTFAARVPVPTLFSLGRFDRQLTAYDLDQLTKSLPNAIISHFEMSGHFPSLEEPMRFNCELRGFARAKKVDESCAAKPAKPFAEKPTVSMVRERYAQPPSRFINVDGVNMHIRDEGSGPVLMLLPGHIGNLHIYDAWTTHLKGEFRVIRADWPPYGLSLPDPSGEYSSKRASDLVIGLIETLGLEKVSLVGTSNGATVAAHVAAYRPDLVERLALSTFPLGAPPRREVSQALIDQAHHLQNMEYRPESFYRAALEDIFFDPSKVTDELVRLYTDVNNHPFSYEAQDVYIKSNLALYASGTLPALYANVRAPVLLQWGDGGTVMPPNLAQGSAEIFTNTDVVLLRYPQSGHMPMLEEPEKTAKDLIRFMHGDFDRKENPSGE